MGRVIYTARWVPDPVVTEINRGNGLHELVVRDTQAVKSIQAFEFKPRRKHISREEKERIKRHNRTIRLVAGLPTALCILTSTMYLAINDTVFLAIAVASYSVTAFIAGVNIFPRKENR